MTARAILGSPAGGNCRDRSLFRIDLQATEQRNCIWKGVRVIDVTSDVPTLLSSCVSNVVTVTDETSSLVVEERC